ncbi:MAG: zf-TFIIB domain-containing protein [Pirellulales bacterium]
MTTQPPTDTSPSLRSDSNGNGLSDLPPTRDTTSQSPRRLVQCRTCRRQYDASVWAPGSRFRCHCGRELEVRPARGHDASVVRCSSCGAPREQQAPHCHFCHSDFTIHELDLTTVCSGCLAHVSCQARFCHHCGTPLTAELSAGSASHHHCPACGPDVQLTSRALHHESVSVLECPHCAGRWLGLESLHLLLASEPRVAGKASPNHVPQHRVSPTAYRPCIVCGELMTRRNFGLSKSGVVVDVCGRHGIWFDADELTQLLAWVRSGGLEDARDELARYPGAPDKVRARAVRNRSKGNSASAASRPDPLNLRIDDPSDAGFFSWGTGLRVLVEIVCGVVSHL